MISFNIVFVIFPQFADDLCLGDTSRKFGPMTPRHTIDAILGLKNCEKLLEGNAFLKVQFI